MKKNPLNMEPESIKKDGIRPFEYGVQGDSYYLPLYDQSISASSRHALGPQAVGRCSYD